MAKVTHVHRYLRIKYGKDFAWRCTLPDCNHFLRKPFMVGKKCICHRCGEEFIISLAALSLKKPHCLGCVESKDNEDIKRIKILLEDSSYEPQR